MEEPQSKSIHLHGCAEATGNCTCLSNNDSNKENSTLNSGGLANVSSHISMPTKTITYTCQTENECNNIQSNNAFTFVDSDEYNNENGHKSNLFSGKYFTFVSKNETSMKAKCMICQRTYSGSIGTTSNFITHLKV